MSKSRKRRFSLKQGDPATFIKSKRKDSDDETCRTLPLSSDFTYKSCLKQKTSSSSTSEDTTKKSVSFDSIEVREHCIVLGDNPSVSYGLPVALAWESTSSFIVSVDEFEDSRIMNRRSESELLLSRLEREALLRSAGYTQRELVSALRSVQKCKRERSASLAQQKSVLAKLLKRTK